ncbi:LysE family translocator [Vibrio marisflavi]|uniref:Homoserine/homoserine lactone efflux protein n=1 Tax=Vibrio marisflavi CECT 7928 TaxID=634439 RepID=A0ABM9A461_9VIBR|nr:LysE family translocator [Vibrio marisflavi]CAH0539630.1 Homoserine/homoserine lactone efflux protein [Vibrio marisflavi CECT 7928]
MSVEHFGAFLVAITILTLTPGLDTALVIRNTTRGGFKDGFVSSVGICSGLFVHATFSAIGISAILMQSAELFHAVKWVGAIYLIWLGVNSLRATLANNQSLAVGKAGVGSVGVKRAFREGFLSNVLNPKTAVFYLAFLPQFIDPQGSVITQSLFLAGIHFVIAMIWQCSLAAALGYATTLLKSSTFMRWMEGTTGAILVSLGLALMLEESPNSL